MVNDYHDEFLAALPRITERALSYFRGVRCDHRKADLVSETVALSWKWWLRLRERGKDPTEFVSALASFATRAARSGRRVCGHEKSKDVMSPHAQREKCFRCEQLESSIARSHLKLYSEPHGQRDTDAYEERLRDNTQTPVPDQAAFRCDFPPWRLSYDERRRGIIDALVAGSGTRDVAQQFGVSPGRISQMRREFMKNWKGYTDDL